MPRKGKRCEADRPGLGDVAARRVSSVHRHAVNRKPGLRPVQNIGKCEATPAVTASQPATNAYPWWRVTLRDAEVLRIRRLR